MGEHFFAYKIMNLFGWPCRLFGIDLGIDAEIEILDEDNRSTGKIIKVQIKSTNCTNEAGNLYLYVDKRHLKYWNKFTMPLIICLIDLNHNVIYWKQITKTMSAKSQHKKVKISFKHNDIIKLGSKSELISLIDSNTQHNVVEIIKYIAESVEYISEGMERYNDGDNFDLEDAKNIYSEIRVLKKLIASGNTLIYNLPRDSIISLRLKYGLLLEKATELMSDFEHIEDVIKTDYGEDEFERSPFTYRDIERYSKFLKDSVD
jgi:hypothetical protein